MGENENVYVVFIFFDVYNMRKFYESEFDLNLFK